MRSLPNFLPRCKGPKLHPFPDRTADISFVRRIGIPGSGESSLGAHSYVFEVSILSKTYALKIFKFYDDREDRAALRFDRGGRDISPSVIHGHRDPFFAECRAYGRLIENNLSGKIAVRCYGHLTVSAELEEELAHKFQAYEWDRPDSDYEKGPRRRQPFRAIIKDLVTEDVPLTEKVVTKMLRDLKRMRRIGIYPMDIEARNYQGGLLIDFSVAITRPHYLFMVKPNWRIEVYKHQDLTLWQEMVESAGLATWERAYRNGDYCKKLRSNKAEG